MTMPISSGTMIVPLTVALVPMHPLRVERHEQRQRDLAMDCASELVDEIATTLLRSKLSGSTGSVARVSSHRNSASTATPQLSSASDHGRRPTRTRARPGSAPAAAARCRRRW